MLALRYGSKGLLMNAFRFRMTCIVEQWSSSALQQIIPITLEAERALRLYVRVGLVIDGVILALREAVKEDI